MKAPLSWLSEHVVIGLPADELASRLALTGTEVERVAAVGVSSSSDVLKWFVVGKVVACEKHPDADKLSVCTVDVGEDQPRTIVCGAPNVRAGQTVAVSLPGAVLPNGMTIAKAKLRGVTSSGMILSEAEVGFEAKSPGIMVLPEEWEAGEPLADRLQLAESVLEVEVTPNRPDCLSIRGLAREIAAVTDETFCEETEYVFPVSSRQAADDISVEVWDPDLCPRYAARVITGVTVADSPAWLKARISHAGMRPVNNVVDVTNYVMWSIGQPLHAFDLAMVEGARVIARRAQAGETIVTLDDTKRVLTEDMLVIADAVKPSVIAGIMGSVDSEVTDSTSNLLLEAANFHGASIMRTSGALGLRSESSTRFEKGLDRNLIPLALDMACAMLTETCGGVVSAGTVDVLAGATHPIELTLRPHRVEQMLGTVVPTAEIEAILGRLGCEVDECPDDDACLQVTVPTWRADLEREIDLVEEIARIHGLELLPSTLPPRTEGRGGLTPDQQAVRRIADALVGAGLDEVVTYSFIEPGWMGQLRLEPADERSAPIPLTNPLSQDQSVMRTMLLPGLLAATRRNLTVREERVHLFEIGHTFHARQSGLPNEHRRLGVTLHGPWEVESWTAKASLPDYYLCKGLLERVFASLGVQADFEVTREGFLHPGRSAAITVSGVAAGWLGEVHPLVSRAFDISGQVVAAEIDLEVVLPAARGVTIFEDLLNHPVLEQDVALVVAEDVQATAVVEAVRAAGGELLRDVEVFDVYTGRQVAAGSKSLALRLTYRSPDRTLAESEVNQLRDTMLAELNTTIGATIRS